MEPITNNNKKPILLKDQPSLEHSIIIKGDDIALNNPWHFHSEIEILYCISGKGTNFIGSYVGPIEEGELLVLGKDLAHTRKRDTEYYEKNSAERPQTIVVKFNENFLGENFFLKQNFSHIDILLKQAQRGIKFYGESRDVVCSLLKKMTNSIGISPILELIAILDILGRSREYVFLNHSNFVFESNTNDFQKINKVLEYTGKHFKEPITLCNVASLINLTEAAFCRYFKARTRKSYFQYLIEVRIANACKMLLEDDKDVAQVCYANGFNNPSNFHKQFKKIVNLTPKEYRYKGQERVPNYG